MHDFSDTKCSETVWMCYSYKIMSVNELVKIVKTQWKYFQQW